MPSILFLISQPRAGSTLLQRMLAAHPDVHTTAEPWLMLPPVYARREAGHTAEYNAALAQTALQDFLATLDDGPIHHDEALRRYATYLYETACAQAGKTIFLDKTPRYYHIIPDLARIFPEARFILLLRNPLAVLASTLHTHVKSHWVLLARYRHDLLTAPTAMLDAIPTLGKRAVVVHYEQLVQHPEAQLQRICAEIELPYDPRMIAYGKTAAPAGRMGDPTNIHRHARPNTTSLDRWETLGSHAQTRHFALAYLEDLGERTLVQLGYSPAPLRLAIENQPATQGKVEFTWQALMHPDKKMEARLVFVEFALLQHRWLAHRIKKWLGRR